MLHMDAHNSSKQMDAYNSSKHTHTHTRDHFEAKLQLANGSLYCLRQYFILDSLNKPAEKNKQWVSIL